MCLFQGHATRANYVLVQGESCELKMDTYIGAGCCQWWRAGVVGASASWWDVTWVCICTSLSSPLQWGLWCLPASLLLCGAGLIEQWQFVEQQRAGFQLSCDSANMYCAALNAIQHWNSKKQPQQQHLDHSGQCCHCFHPFLTLSSVRNVYKNPLFSPNFFYLLNLCFVILFCLPSLH